MHPPLLPRRQHPERIYIDASQHVFGIQTSIQIETSRLVKREAIQELLTLVQALKTLTWPQMLGAAHQLTVCGRV